MNLTPVFYKNAAAKEPIVINQGGSSSSKTYSILQLIYMIALKKPGVTISVVSETMPHLKRGAMRDFICILEADDLYSPAFHNKTDGVYSVGKSKIEFFSADNYERVKGPRRDYLFVNEANHIPYETFYQLHMRTKVRSYIDYNPEGEFWAHTEIMPAQKHSFIHSTYLDNPFLSDKVISDITSRAERDEYFKKVYLLGEVGVLKGVIYDNWKVSSWPQGCKLIGYGLDFGYVNDPTALVRVGINNGELYLSECVYEPGLVNVPISDSTGRVPANIHQKLIDSEVYREDNIIADSAEMKSINELALKGWNIIGARKTNVKQEIDQVKRFALNVTPESVNLIRELRNYKWKQDRDGNPMNEPVDAYNHGLDAFRYLVMSYLNRRSSIRRIA